MHLVLGSNDNSVVVQATWLRQQLGREVAGRQHVEAVAAPAVIYDFPFPSRL